MKQMLICPIQIQSLVVYLTILVTCSKAKKKVIAIKHLLVSAKSKYMIHMWK